jgi:hypothetical protein
MNLTLRGRLWQVLVSRDLWPSFATGIYPRPHRNAVFRWWRIGYWEVRRFYHIGECDA